LNGARKGLGEEPPHSWRASEQVTKVRVHLLLRAQQGEERRVFRRLAAVRATFTLAASATVWPAWRPPARTNDARENAASGFVHTHKRAALSPRLKHFSHSSLSCRRLHSWSRLQLSVHLLILLVRLPLVLPLLQIQRDAPEEPPSRKPGEIRCSPVFCLVLRVPVTQG
jgi:hypothetical protein